MADKKPAPAADAAAPKAKLPLVPIIGAVVGTAILVGGIMFFMMPTAAPAEGDESAEHADEAGDGPAEAKAESRYIEVRDPLVVNLTGGGARFLQVRVTLATRSEPGQKAIETHMPAIQNALLAMLQRATPEELAAPDLMTTLQGKALTETNKVLEAETGTKDTASAVIFTSFVRQ